MRIIKYQHESDNPAETAHVLVGELEVALGLKLQVDDQQNPNDVHGYLNTSSDGSVEVHLYEPNDVQKIKARPSKHTAHKNIHKVHPIRDDALVSRLDGLMKNQKGFAAHPDMEGKPLIRQNLDW